MKKNMSKLVIAGRLAVLVLGICWCLPSGAALTAQQQAWLGKAKRFERAGWVYIQVEGGARERGFQHGYLLAHEITDGMHTTRVGWEHLSAMTWPWLVERAAAMLAPKVDAENLEELAGIAEGLTAAGSPATRDEVLAYNAYIELSDYWWPAELKRIKEAATPSVRQSCSSFIATGRFTADGNIVLGHNTMQGYSDAFPNVIEYIIPEHGHRILWQTTPGWIHSGTDFFITDAGLVGSETTIGSYEGFDTNGVPEFVRMRRATQDAGSLDEWCRVMRENNNGGYANSWLLGDVNTKEIARLELGLKQVGFEKKRDGYFVGSNVAEDPKLLRLETTADETDIRSSSVARRLRWKELMKECTGKIDASSAKRFESDHFDYYRGKTQPSGRTLCGHFDLDPEPASPWPGVPYGCAGTVDAKVVDAAMARRMSFAARWGSACGMPFKAQKFLAAHPQFDWMTDILKDRPVEPWTDFRAGE
jgi:hypothetical protein